MLKKLLFTLLSTSMLMSGIGLPVLAHEDEDIRAYLYPIYRLYNKNSGEHFYTEEDEEKDHLSSIGWKYEGIAWYAPGYKYLYDAERGFDPFVYRLYNPNSGEHHYTEDTNERSVLMRAGWKSEKICWYSEDKTKKVPVYRVYNPNAKNAGSHHYTTDISERNALVSAGWKDEGIAWYGEKEGELIPYTPEPTPSVPTQTDYSAAYRPILDEAKRIVESKGMVNDYREELYGLKEASWNGTVNDIGYTIQDLSGDGIPELAIVNKNDSSHVIALYTLVANRPVNTLYGWSRSFYFYAGGSQFIYQGSGGALSSTFGLLSLSQDGQKQIYNEYYYTEPNSSWSSANTYLVSGPISLGSSSGPTLPGTSKRTGKYIGGQEVASQKSQEILSKKQSLNFTPFSQWK